MPDTDESADHSTELGNRSREGIIRAVQTPLAFFVLVALIVEALLGVVAGLTEGRDRTLAIAGIMVILAFLVLLVGFLAYYRPESLKGLRAPLSESSRISAPRIAFRGTINETYASMWTRIESIRPRPNRLWATYLNPEAFASGDVAPDLKRYYEKAERLNAGDYRRVFGIYPDLPEYQERRRRSTEWLHKHVKRTHKLDNYQIRFVLLEFQAAEVLIDDKGVSYSFPSARVSEAGWATTNPLILDLMKDYFQQVWDRATPIEELLTEAKANES